MKSSNDEINTQKTTQPPASIPLRDGINSSALGPLGSLPKEFDSHNSPANLNPNHIKKSVRAKKNIKNRKKWNKFQSDTSHPSQVYNTFIQKFSKAPRETIVLPYPDCYSRTMIGTNSLGKKLIFMMNCHSLVESNQALNPTLTKLKSLIKDLYIMGTHRPHQKFTSITWSNESSGI